ncbi:glycosyltransferase family 2 protein [Paenibacillus terrigena]|uniref:glycosyltransferase family 2 protein n=1 Tax=Paenibacillus terrigena TaxID=369333 RepID=UPI0028D2EBAD|nr:glycosyltransferase family 2 protein [Paenibacillus terrigena]
MEKVQVLMSTYNGEAFLDEQLQSILQQSYTEVSILVRDDGSKDNTVSVIDRIIEKNPGEIVLISGVNLGVVQSFFELLRVSDDDASYYCFCDQDDVWMSDKIERAIRGLQSCTAAGMFFTSTMLVDQDLKEIKVWPSPHEREPSFYNSLVQNIAVGATMVINKAARDLLICKIPNTNNLLMHDWWAYTCISAFGEVLYDSNPTIYYRQHGKNVVGGNTTVIQKWKKKWESFRKHSGDKLLRRQAIEFANHYGSQLEAEKLNQLQLFIQSRRSLKQRLNYLHKSKLYRQSWTENQLFKFLVLIDYI